MWVDAKDGKEWYAEDAQTVEYEVARLLREISAVLQPQIILETGCYLGRSTRALGDGCPRAMLYSCDTRSEYVVASRTECAHLPNCSIRQCNGAELCRDISGVELAFLDSGGDRVEEARSLQLANRGIVILHDSSHPDWHGIRELGWQEIYFPTARGLSIFQAK